MYRETLDGLPLAGATSLVLLCAEPTLACLLVPVPADAMAEREASKDEGRPPHTILSFMLGEYDQYERLPWRRDAVDIENTGGQFSELFSSHERWPHLNDFYILQVTDSIRRRLNPSLLSVALDCALPWFEGDASVASGDDSSASSGDDSSACGRCRTQTDPPTSAPQQISNCGARAPRACARAWRMPCARAHARARIRLRSDELEAPASEAPICCHISYGILVMAY